MSASKHVWRCDPCNIEFDGRSQGELADRVVRHMSLVHGKEYKGAS